MAKVVVTQETEMGKKLQGIFRNHAVYLGDGMKSDILELLGDKKPVADLARLKLPNKNQRVDLSKYQDE